jgi:non-specific serine/threonine protein kinase
MARRVAAEVQRAFPDGVWQVELADLTDPALLGHEVAFTLGLKDQSSDSGTARLIDYLVDKRLLLLLDNCEHLIDACAVLVDALLRGCPELHVLATSRQPLGISGESILTVQPLPVPDPDRGSSVIRALARVSTVARRYEGSGSTPLRTAMPASA